MSQDSRNRARPKVLIELRTSKSSGIGVFAVRHIRSGQRIADGIGQQDYKELIPWKEFEKLDGATRKKIRDFCIGAPDGFIPPENLDFNRLSIEWYLNHSCAPNVGFDSSGDFLAIRDIKKGEELTYDYGFAESNPRFKMRCNCGSKKCRGIITGNDWKKREFRNGRIKHMLPRLRKIRSPVNRAL